MSTGYMGPNGQWVTPADQPANRQMLNWVDATAPAASSAAPGAPGQVATNGAYLYIYVSQLALWRRVALETY